MSQFEKVEAFKASDGKLFLSEIEAVEYEAKSALMRCLGNQGLVNDIMNKQLAVHAALTPLVELLHKQPKVDEKRYSAGIDESGAPAVMPSDA